MKIMILVNKNFEYAGYRSGVNQLIAEGMLPHLHVIRNNVDADIDKFLPLREYELIADNERHLISEYCINYFFDEGENSSNSKSKFDKLKKLFEKLEFIDELPDYIISVSTSESTLISQGGKKGSVNGCVFMGNKFFAKDCRIWDDPQCQSKLDVIPYLENEPIFSDFYELVKRDQDKLTTGMIVLPNHSSKKLECIANSNDTSLGVINITNYKKYIEADSKTFNEFLIFNKEIMGDKLNPIGIETTHAVINMAADNIPVLFVSPIVDRFLCFKEDVVEDWGEQNLKGSYNAGVVVANMLECFRNEFPKNFKEEE